MNARKIILIATFALTLGAGLAAGKLSARLPGSIPVVIGGPHSPLGDQLQLSPEQNDRMKVIWEGTRDKLDDCFARSQSLQQERDDAIVALLTAEQKQQYAKIGQAYVDKFAELTARRQAAFQQAVHRTEQILTESQKLKYQEILHNRVGHAAPIGSSAFESHGMESHGMESHGAGSQ